MFPEIRIENFEMKHAHGTLKAAAVSKADITNEYHCYQCSALYDVLDFKY
jgi:hypothetical protein